MSFFRNLPVCDYGQTSDPFVKIFTLRGPYNPRHPHWVRFGETGTVSRNLNPVWANQFVFPYKNGTQQVYFTV